MNTLTILLLTMQLQCSSPEIIPESRIPVTPYNIGISECRFFKDSTSINLSGDIQPNLNRKRLLQDEQDNMPEWILPVAVTVAAGTGLYLLYRVRGR